MSEKQRQKKDGQDTNKKDQRMKEVNKPADKQNMATSRQDKTASGQGKQSRERRTE
jgi:hypothetical protein